MGSLYQSVTHCVSSLFWCKCHELSAYLVSYIAMMVREDELIGFSIQVTCFLCQNWFSLCHHLESCASQEMLLNKHCYLL